MNSSNFQLFRPMNDNLTLADIFNTKNFRVVVHKVGARSKGVGQRTSLRFNLLFVEPGVASMSPLIKRFYKPILNKLG